MSEIAGFAAKFIVPFLLFCLVCSAIREAIETVLNDRAKYLHRALSHLMNDYGGGGFLAMLYSHPLIDGLYFGRYDPKNLHNLPPYIPSRTFALALMDLIKPADSPGKQATLSGSAYSTLPGTTKTVEDLRRAVGEVLDTSQSGLKAALLALLDAAGGDPVRARQNIEGWFEAAMNRASGWYKQRTQVILSLIGSTFAFALNLDGIALGQYLITHDAVMSAIADQIKAQVTNPHANLVDIVNVIQQQGKVPIGWSSATMPHTPADWFLKVCGIYAIGFLMAIGSPFCFDVLNKFMVVRSAGKPADPVVSDPTAAESKS